MHRNTKIATCSYCGTRAALVLDTGQQELVCRACGAQLHEIKAMPVSAKPAKASKYAASGKPGRTAPAYQRFDDEHLRRRKAPKKKSRAKKVKGFFEEAFDLIEDIFD